eukprot:COSAG04_NODE_12665_length_641_cov_0.878229_1_plen_76_part_10
MASEDRDRWGMRLPARIGQKLVLFAKKCLLSSARIDRRSIELGDSLDSEIPSTHRRPSYALSAFNNNNHNTNTKMS